MSEAAEGAAPSRPALQPFTFGGLAAFAQIKLGRLWLVEAVFAVFAAMCVVIAAQHAYAGVVLQAIEQMPETARITHGQISGIDTALIAETKLLAIAVTPKDAEQIGQSADVQVQFRPADFRIDTVFLPDRGWEFDYGRDRDADLSRAALEPWWGAWRPVFLATIGVLTVAGLFVNWAVLALIYTLPAKVIAWWGDHQLTWPQSWRVGCMALMPGSLLMSATILLYAWRAVDLLGFGFFFVAHLLMGWFYLTGAILARPRLFASPVKQNPFKV